MTIYNHTDIASGAAADASTFNGPLGQLDAAIGDLTALTTTDKTSVKAALNEVDLHADTVQTQVNVSLDPDGTLKAGAVDNSAAIANGVVSGAKIVDATIDLAVKAQAASITTTLYAPLSLPGTAITKAATTVPNLMWDDHNLYTSPVLAEEWGGKYRWHPRTSQAALDAVVTVIDPDTSNPYSAPTLRMLSTGGGLFGKYIDLSEVGLKAGDTVNFSVWVKPTAAAGTWVLRSRGYTAAGATSGSLTSGVSYNFGSGSWDGLARELTTVPSGGGSVTVDATAKYLLVWIQQTVGGADLDIYNWGGWKGDYIPSHFSNSSAPTNFYQEIIDARGVWSTLSQRIDNLSPDADVYGRQYTRDWQAAVGKVQNAVAGAQAVIAFCGDSWVFRDYIRSRLATTLQGLYGDAGSGWVSFYQHYKYTTSGYRNGFGFATTGTWTESDRVAGSLGIDISHITSSGTGGTVTVSSTGTVNTMVIQYYRLTNGGSFTWAVDGGGATTVSTAGAAGIQTVTISGLSNATHTLVLTITAAGSANVTLIGVDLQKDGNGVRVHKCGCAGAHSQDFVDVDAAQWEASLLALAPNLVVFLLGTNDATVGPISTATYGANLQTLTDRVHAVLPRADVLLLPSADNNGLSIANYDAAAKDAAITKSVAYLSSYANLGDYTTADARGLYSDTTHVNAEGGRAIANLMVERILRVS
jgi:lysophospholipase L1-like esterase